MEAGHLIDIEHRVDIERINKEVREFPPLHPECCIYRVNDGLRKGKPEAYEPMLVSIGPYHHQNPKLLTMRRHKLRYLHLLLKRRGEESVERYILELEKLEGRTRKCYADPMDQAFNSSEKFVEMMLLDGCFIIEYLRRDSSEVNDEDDPIRNTSWMDIQIVRDMMLLENQLPYFVVSKLYDMTKNDFRQPFVELAGSCVSSMLPISPPMLRNSCGIDGHKVEHLLHLMHMISYPLSEVTTSNTNSYEPADQMGSVVELEEAGVKFKMIDTSRVFNDVCLLDVKFDNGSMEIPRIKVGDSAETILRNLIAYEQQHSTSSDLQIFSTFLWFMDQLISSENDVKLLRRRGIIKNLLGDDKAVSDIFNKLCDGVSLTTQSLLYFSQVRQKVNIHCERPWNQMMAKLKHDYFNTPWAGVSTIAAIVLLILTFLQTFAALKSPSTWFK